MTHPSERMSEAEKMPPKVTKDDWTHPDRIAWIKESTDTLSSFGGHVVHDLADAITQLRTDLAAANERAERAEAELDDARQLIARDADEKIRLREALDDAKEDLNLLVDDLPQREMRRAIAIYDKLVAALHPTTDSTSEADTTEGDEDE